MSKTSSWKPVRNGDIYCSTACGGRCTWGKNQEATRNAKLLAKTMGKGWKPRVWENLGWHYSVMLGGKDILKDSAIYPESGGYWASVHVGEQYTAVHRDPRKAFLSALKDADKELKHVTKVRAMMRKLGY